MQALGVLVVDRHPVIRYALSSLLDTRVAWTAEAATSDEAWHVVRNSCPGVVVLELEREGATSGAETVTAHSVSSEILANPPVAPFIALRTSDTALTAGSYEMTRSRNIAARQRLFRPGSFYGVSTRSTQVAVASTTPAPTLRRQYRATAGLSSRISPKTRRFAGSREDRLETAGPGLP